MGSVSKALDSTIRELMFQGRESYLDLKPKAALPDDFKRSREVRFVLSLRLDLCQKFWLRGGAKHDSDSYP